ncbi:MAG: ATP-binding cassette domain-containing protein [Spirochaetia bacterium]|nr:ATP-binding cassette domain-containing protein [Spirochaetia bacterium]
MSNGKSIVLKDIHFSYEPHEPVVVIGEISFDPGMISVILGGNGTGKTTLLKIIAGILTPQSGTVSLSQGRISDDSIYIHQDPYLLKGRVDQNLTLLLPGLRRHGKHNTDESVGSLLDSWGLSGFAGRHTHTLSGGEKKRVAVACAMAADRSVVLMDEPTAHMDSESIHTLEQQIRALKEAGKTVIITTHNHEFAFRIANSVWEMDNGTPHKQEFICFRGNITGSDEYFSYFRSGLIELKVVQTDREVSTAVIAGSDIIISRHELDSSARNTLHGTIRTVEKQETLVILTIDCGQLLRIPVTRKSVETMKIGPGSDVCAVFKASAVRLY